MLRTALGWLQIATVAVALLATLDVALLRGQPANARVDLSAYFGGSGNDSASLVSVDEAGNYYLAGSTDSRDFPVRDSIFPLPPSTGTTPPVGFLTKLRADGLIVYSRYLPRPLAALAVDAQGNATIADNVPAFLRGRALGDFVISKLDANGTELYSVRFAGSGLEQATALALDETGAVVITGNTDSPDFPLVNPLQPAVLPGDDGFDRSAFVTRLDALGRIAFSTGWGGTGEDLGAAIAIDRAGAITLAGTTRSIDFPTTAGAFQRTLFSLNCSPFQSPCADAFVTRFSADGRSVIYSTLFGGTNAETVSAAALDAGGSVHVAGTTASPDLPLRRAIQTACDNGRPINQGNACSQYIVRLNPGGTALEYSTYFGSRADYVNGAGLSITSLAADGAGAVLVTGVTHGNDLPLARPLLTVNAGGPLFKSTDEARSWSSASDGISGTGVWFLTAGGRASQTFYASSLVQLFRSDDQGRRWIAQRASDPQAGPFLAVDPLVPTTIYSLGSTGCLKSTDGGETWTRLPLDQPLMTSVAVAPSAPSNVYVTAQRGLFHSPNGGVTWSSILDVNPADTPPGHRPVLVAVDPQDAEILYVSLSDGSLRRKDAQTWNSVASFPCPVDQLQFAAAPPATMYARACGDVWKSVDGARSWRRSDLGRMAAWIALDRSAPDDVYVAASTAGIYRSKDRGETWARVSNGFGHDFRSMMVDPFPARTIYAGATDASNAFVTRFDASGQVTFSTYLGGFQSSGASVTTARDSSIVVAGGAGQGFPQVRPFEPAYRGGLDAFLTRISLPE